MKQSRDTHTYMTLWESRALTECVRACISHSRKSLQAHMKRPAWLYLWVSAAPCWTNSLFTARQMQSAQLAQFNYICTSALFLWVFKIVSYLCSSLESLDFCRDACFQVFVICCRLRLRALTGWCMSAQLSVITSAPREYSPSLCMKWHVWITCCLHCNYLLICNFSLF